MVTNRLLFRRIISWSVEVATRLSGGPQRQTDPAIVADVFIADPASTAMSHASSIAESVDGLVAAWFGGSLESRPDVAIFVARKTHGGDWSEPHIVATGEQDNGSRFACWNPVLFQPDAGPLLLFYKVGKNPRSWWGMVTSSDDGGKSWASPRRLPEGILGPVKNKPVQIKGQLVCPSSTEHDGWRVHLESSPDLAESWHCTMPIGGGASIGAIQPSLLVHSEQQLQLLCRSKHHRIAESWSSDGGTSWSDLQLTGLPNPNSGTDAVSLADGRQLLVYNCSSRRRSPLNLALSSDGRCWSDRLILERGPGEYSYPAVIQTSDGLVHITYSWNLSRIRHVCLDPSRL